MKSRELVLGLGILAFGMGPIKVCNGPTQSPDATPTPVPLQKITVNQDDISVYKMDDGQVVCYVASNKASSSVAIDCDPLPTAAQGK